MARRTGPFGRLRELMDHSTRMLRTLGVLVLSMTGTATLLGWVDPGANPSQAANQHAVLIQMAQDAVARDVDVRAARWDTVELVAVPPVASGSRLLLAERDSDPAHFVLDEFGRCMRSDLWSLQRGTARRPGAIRVKIVQRTANEPMSAAQWTGVRALVGALEAVVPVDRGLRAVVDSSWATAYGVAPGEPVAIDSIPVVQP